MKINVNGKEVSIEKVVSIQELLNLQNVEMQDYVTVQLNEELVSREDFENSLVKENDTVEFLYFMGGGK